MRRLDKNSARDVGNTVPKIKTVEELHFEELRGTYDFDDASYELEKDFAKYAVYLLYSDGSKYDLDSGDISYEEISNDLVPDLTKIFDALIKDKNFIFNKKKVQVFVKTSIFDNNFAFLSKIDTNSIELILRGSAGFGEEVGGKQIDFKGLGNELLDKLILEYQHCEFPPSQRSIYLAKNTKFTGCVFNGIFIQNVHYIDTLEFNRCIFKNVFTLEQLKCKKLIISYSTAENNFTFNHIEIYEVLELRSNSFQNLVSFYKFGFGGFINISSSRYAQGINFSNIYLLVRETRGRGRFLSNYRPTSLYKYEHVVHNIYALARLYDLDIKDLRTSISLIKQSLDSGGNSIDADKFYAMEMSIHFQEMKLWSVETGLRKILFFTNWFISDYYQSFGKAVLMFFLFNFFVAIYQVDGFSVIIDKTFTNMFIYYEMLSNFVNMQHNELRGKVLLALVNTYFYFQIIRASRTGLKR